MGNRITAVKLCPCYRNEELRAIERENHYKTTYKPEITEKGMLTIRNTQKNIKTSKY